MKNILITVLLTVFILLFVFLADVSAQNRGQRGGGRGGRGPRPNAPPTPGTPQPDAQPAAEAGIGEVPKLVPPPGSVASLQVVDLTESDTIVPSIQYKKVLRYATQVFEKYDLNKNGFLERDEWLKMPGQPQSIDTDGDFVITLEEYLRFIALYGNARTIHRPNPPQPTVRTAVDTSTFQVFRPLSAPFPAPKQEQAEADQATPESAATEIDENKIIGESEESDDSESEDVESETTETPPDDSATSAEGETEEKEPLDDLTYEKVFEGKYKPSEKKYYVPLSELRGVPNWFVFRDKDGDGQLSMVEYDPTLSPAGLARFGRMDKNGDGFLSANEVREALKK